LGGYDYGQCSPPALSGVTAISAGTGIVWPGSPTHGGGWGSDTFGQAEVPLGLSGVNSVLAVWNYSLLKNDGTVVAWAQRRRSNQRAAGLNSVVALAGIKIIAWR